MKKKILGIVMISLFLGSSVIPSITSSSVDNKMVSLEDNTQCYGFIVPIVKLENKTLENDINCRIYHMINDLLRENITVYWSSTDFNVSITKINENIPKKVSFDKGTFVIPLSSDDAKNLKICTIAYDYNYSSEIDIEKRSVPIFELLEQCSINAYSLVKVKIARYHGSRNLDAQYLLQLNLIETGFLDFDLIKPKDIKSKLNLKNFNVMFWPGGNTDLVNINWRKSVIEEFVYGVQKTIRNFVNDGGSYFGCCYGSLKASSFSRYNIFRPIYFPLLKIINIWTYLHDNGVHDLCTQNIQDTNHPVTYGVNETITDFYGGGPRIIHIGKYVKVISKIDNAHENVDGTASWVSSEYGDGKVVVFTSHPEIVDYFEGIYVGKRIIANTLFYTTSKISKDFNLLYSMNISSINSIFENTSNLTFDIIEEFIIFNDLSTQISSIINLTVSQKSILKTKLELVNENFQDKEYFVGFLNRYINRIFTNLNSSLDIISLINETIEILESVISVINESNNIDEKIVILNDYFKSRTDEINQCILDSESRLTRLNRRIYSLINGVVLIKDFTKNSIKKDVYEIIKSYSEIYVYIVQIYFESLKFLRHNWYEYEITWNEDCIDFLN